MRLVVCVLVLLSASAGQASEIYFTRLPANFENGTYNGFVSGTIDGVLFNNLICNDYDEKTYVPSGPIVFHLSVLDTLTYARFVDLAGEPTSTDVQRYQEAALLLEGMQGHPTLTADYQYAIWRLFTPAVSVYKSSELLLDNVRNVVEHSEPATYADVYNRLRIYTPDAGYESNQEFLGLAPVPEPGSFWLLAAGIGLATLSLAIGWGLRRFRSGPPHAPV